jgi:hypothetical protein
MNCQQFEQRIHEVLDENKRLGEDAALLTHSVACPSCRKSLSEFKLLESYFNANHSIVSRLAHRLSTCAALSSSRRSASMGWLTFGALAAGLLATIIPLSGVGSLQTARQSALVARKTEGIQPSVAQPAEMSYSELLATIEALPGHFDEIAPVCNCTAQLAGVSPLTSSLSLTVDLLRWQLQSAVPVVPSKDQTWRHREWQFGRGRLA